MVEIKNVVTGNVTTIQASSLDSYCVDNSLDKETVFQFLDHPAVIAVNNLVFTTVKK